MYSEASTSSCARTMPTMVYSATIARRQAIGPPRDRAPVDGEVDDPDGEADDQRPARRARRPRPRNRTPWPPRRAMKPGSAVSVSAVNGLP